MFVCGPTLSNMIFSFLSAITYFWERNWEVDFEIGLN